MPEIKITRLESNSVQELFSANSIILGSQSSSDVRWDPRIEPNVSASHASIYYKNSKLLIADLGGVNGTYVNGIRIKIPTEVSPNCEIRLGIEGPKIHAEYLLNSDSSFHPKCSLELRHPLEQNSDNANNDASNKFQVAKSSSPNKKATLQTRFFWTNWRIRRNQSAEYMILRQGESTDRLATLFANQMIEEDAEMKVGLAWLTPSIVNRSRTIRVIKSLGLLHKVCTDVVIQKKGDDLYIRLNSFGFSGAALFRKIIMISLIISCAAVMFWLTASKSGFYDTWRDEYAKKHAFTSVVHFLNINFQPPNEGLKAAQDRAPTEPLKTDVLLKSYLESGDLFTISINRPDDILRAMEYRRAFGEIPAINKSLSDVEDKLVLSDPGMKPTIDILRDKSGQAVASFRYQLAALLFGDFRARQDLEQVQRFKDPMGESRGLGSQSYNQEAAIQYAYQVAGMDGIKFDPNHVNSVADNIQILLPAWHQATKGRWGPKKLFNEDPILFLQHLGLAPMLVTGLMGAILLIFPKSWTKLIAVLMGWPTPDYFEGEIEGHRGRVMSILSTVQSSLGISNSEVIKLGE